MLAVCTELCFHWQFHPARPTQHSFRIDSFRFRRVAMAFGDWLARWFERKRQPSDPTGLNTSRTRGPTRHYANEHHLEPVTQWPITKRLCNWRLMRLASLVAPGQVRAGPGRSKISWLRLVLAAFRRSLAPPPRPPPPPHSPRFQRSLPSFFTEFFSFYGIP